MIIELMYMLGFGEGPEWTLQRGVRQSAGRRCYYRPLNNSLYREAVRQISLF